MQIRLDSIGDQRFTWTETLDLGDDALGEGLAALGLIECRGSIERMPDGMLLRIQLAYPRTLECVRCLGTWPETTKDTIDLLINVDEENDGKASEGDEDELDREDLGLLLLSEPEIDTEPLVREQVRLAVPMKPLCREDCAGLCGRCGADLNEGLCECGPEVDPRWAALSGLRRPQS